MSLYSWDYTINHNENEDENEKRSYYDISRPTVVFMIFWNFLMFCQIFLAPQMKRCANITNKHRKYELPHELLNDLRLKILGN